MLAIGSSRAGTPIALALGALALAGWSLVFARGLVFDADPSRLRPAGAPAVEASRALERALGFAPLPILALPEASTPVDAIAAAVLRLRASGVVGFDSGPQRALPGEHRAERLTAFRARTAGWVDAALEDLVNAGFRAEAFRAVLEEQRARFEAAPVLDGSEPAIEHDGVERGIVALHPARTARTRAEREELFALVRAAFGPDVPVVDAFTLADELAPLLAADLTRSLSVSGLAVLVVVALTVGPWGRSGRPRRPSRWLPALFALAPVACGLGLVLGGLVLFGVPLHPGNFVALPLILGLGVDDGIHVTLRSVEGDPQGLAHTASAVWRTSATTAIGFGSLAAAESPVLGSLGILVLAGVLVCFVASVWLLPALLRLAPR
jgi:hypothetical protein